LTGLTDFFEAWQVEWPTAKVSKNCALVWWCILCNAPAYVLEMKTVCVLFAQVNNAFLFNSTSVLQ